MSLEATESESAAVAVAPRVSLAEIEAAIAERFDTTGYRAVQTCIYFSGPHPPHEMQSEHPLGLLSICILVMRNGFTVIGKSAPASAQNFSAELGRKLAYEDAVRQVWPLMGFALRQKLSEAA